MDQKVYTKKGDKGSTYSPFGMVNKSHAWIDLVGSIDESQAMIGLAHAKLTESFSEQKSQLELIMRQLFRLSGDLYRVGQEPLLANDNDKKLEQWIDAMTAKIPELSQFILPIGAPASVQCHAARSVVRRMERTLHRFQLEDQGNRDIPMAFVNRLSDYLFVLARYVNIHSGFQEKTSR